MKNKSSGAINPEMILLDMFSDYPATEQIVRRYDAAAGVCICCENLFDTVATVAETYGLELGRLLEELNSVTVC